MHVSCMYGLLYNVSYMNGLLCMCPVWMACYTHTLHGWPAIQCVLYGWPAIVVSCMDGLLYNVSYMDGLLL